MAVMGVLLYPPAVGSSVVDVVAVRLLDAASEIGPLQPKSRILPVRVICEKLLDPHRVYEATRKIITLRSGANDPVADLRSGAYLGFARCQAAASEEWVRCETIVPGDDVRVQRHRRTTPHPQLYRLIERGARTVPS